MALHRTEKKNKSESARTAVEEVSEKSRDEDTGMSVTEIVKMVPGEWVSFSSVADEFLHKTVTSSEPMTEWKDGVLTYQDVEFQFMLENLEDIFGKTFEVSDSVLLRTRINVGIPYEDWEKVTDMMEWMLGIRLVEINDVEVRIEKRKEN